MKNTKLVWRLGKLPSVTELTQLVHDKIITNEEAREILFSSETEETKDLKSLEAEVKFLKELLMALPARSQIIETIKYIEKPYYRQWPWYGGMVTCLSSSGTGGINLTNGSSSVNLIS